MWKSLWESFIFCVVYSICQVSVSIPDLCCTSHTNSVYHFLGVHYFLQERKKERIQEKEINDLLGWLCNVNIYLQIFFFFFWALTHLEKELLLVFSFHLKKNNKKQSGRRNMTQFLCFILIFKWSSTLCVERSLLSNASHVKPLFAAGQTISTVILIAPYSQFKNRRM